MSITDLADSSWFVSLVRVVPWDFTIQHIAVVLIEFIRVAHFLIIFPPLCTTSPSVPRDWLINAALRVSAMLLNAGTFLGLYIRSRQG